MIVMVRRAFVAVVFGVQCPDRQGERRRGGRKGEISAVSSDPEMILCAAAPSSSTVLSSLPHEDSGLSYSHRHYLLSPPINHDDRILKL